MTGRATLRGRDYIETLDWTTEEIDETLGLASELKEKFKRGETHRLLPDRTLFMLFLDKSTRTRNAFEAGMTQLGGHAHFLDAEKTQIAHGESPKDMGIILSRYGHGLAIRHDLVPYEGNAYMREVARWADIPVINLQCDVDHPTQTLADLMTMREQRGHDLRGLRDTHHRRDHLDHEIDVVAGRLAELGEAAPAARPRDLDVGRHVQDVREPSASRLPHTSPGRFTLSHRRMVALYDAVRREDLPAAAGKDVAAGRAPVVRVLRLHRGAANIAGQPLRFDDRLAALGTRGCPHHLHVIPAPRHHSGGGAR